MWTWIFLVIAILASFIAFVLWLNAGEWRGLLEYWKARSEESDAKLREERLERFSTLAAYCRADFSRRMLCAEVTSTSKGAERTIVIRGAPGGQSGESWRLSVTVEHAGLPVHASIGAAPNGRASEVLALKLEPDEAWHKRAIRLFAEERESGFLASKLTHEEARPLIEAFLGEEGRPALPWSVDFGPPPGSNFPSLDDPLDDMD